MIQGAFLLLASLSAPQAAGEGPIARWAFDGDVKDSGPSAIPTQAVGRLEFIDSPIGGSGKTESGFEMALWLNGERSATLSPREPIPDPAGAGLKIQPFAGMMDDLRLYRRALSQDELCRLVDDGLPWIRPKPHAKTPFPGK